MTAPRQHPTPTTFHDVGGEVKPWNALSKIEPKVAPSREHDMAGKGTSLNLIQLGKVTDPKGSLGTME